MDERRNGLDICLLGHFESAGDEGVARIALELRESLGALHNVDAVDLRDKSAIFSMLSHGYDVVHMIACPANLVPLSLLGLLEKTSRRTLPVLTAAQPSQGIADFRVRVVKRSIALVQSHRDIPTMERLGFRAVLFPNGVDTHKFKPLEDEDRERMREGLGWEEDDFVVLHVGPVKANRNLELFMSLPNLGCRVVIVSRADGTIDRQLLTELTSSGCEVLVGYQKNIETFFQISDCYVFPRVRPSAVIRLPLSILEAMACNLPVICDKTSAVAEWFPPTPGLFFASSSKEILTLMEGVSANSQKPNVRDLVIPFDWSSIAEMLTELYIERLE